MRRLLTVVAVLVFVISCSGRTADEDVGARIKAVENGLIEFKSLENIFHPDGEQLANPRTLTERMEHYKTPGLSIAVIDDNRLAWAKAYGVMDADTGQAVTTETIFEAGSTSKLITAVIALHFVQEGLVDLDENVNSYLKRWQAPENEFTKEEKVTLRRLLSHQAGMPATNYDFEEGSAYPTLIDVLNGDPPALNKPAIPEYRPGSKWQYSNIGFNVIELLLEDLAGKPFHEIAAETVFKPLAMSESSFVYPLDDERKRREAIPHDAEGVSREPMMHLTALAHGGLTTTPADLARFAIELMRSYHGESEKIVSRETVNRLFSKECEIDREKFPLPFSDGLGVFLMGEGEDLMFSHPGSNNPGLICWPVGWPEHRTGVVVMTNGANGLFLASEIIEAVNIEYNSSGKEAKARR